MSARALLTLGALVVGVAALGMGLPTTWPTVVLCGVAAMPLRGRAPSLTTRISVAYAAPLVDTARAIALLPRRARHPFAPLARQVWLHALALERLDAALDGAPAGAGGDELRARRAELVADQARLVTLVQETIGHVLIGEA